MLQALRKLGVVAFTALLYLLASPEVAPAQTAASSPAVALSSSNRTSLQRTTLVRVKAALAASAGNNPVENADYPSPPTPTNSNTHDATLTVQAFPRDNPTQFGWGPGTRYTRTAAKTAYIASSNQAIGTGNISLVSGLDQVARPGDNSYVQVFGFQTSSQIVELFQAFGATVAPYRLTVNGQYISRSAGRVNTQPYDKYDFGSQQLRTFVVEYQNGQAFGGVSVSAGQTITAYNGLNDVSAIAFGDSITEGISNGDTVKYVWDNWFSTSGKLTGVTLAQNAGVGGTGCWNQSGGATNNRTRVGDQIPYWPNAQKFDIVVFAAGYNDAGQISNATIQALCMQAWQRARAQYPQAIIVVMGVFGEATGPSANVIATENALAAQFAIWNDPCAIFVPVSTDAAGAWISGTDYVGHIVTGIGNSGTWVSSDGLHPSQVGQLGIAAKANTAIRAQLPTLFTRFNVNWLLKRDLAPASNDNDPMWLEKAA